MRVATELAGILAAFRTRSGAAFRVVVPALPSVVTARYDVSEETTKDAQQVCRTDGSPN